MISDALRSAVDDLLSPWDSPTSPGCAIGLIRDGELVHERAVGMANLEYGVPIGPSSVFYIASVSKQFTAACILLLARQGRLALDDDIRSFIPEMPDYGARIRVRDLVHHTSGLRDHLDVITLSGGNHQDHLDSAGALRVIVSEPALNFPTGARYEYSNANYALLAEIVHRASGSTLRRYAQEHIFGPLGMTTTRFDDDHREILPQRVVSYEEVAPGEYRHFIKAIDAVGDGNIVSTVGDLALWDRDFVEQKVGGPGFSAERTARGRLSDGTEVAYSAGLRSEPHRGLPTVEHAGGFLGFRTYLLRFPEQRLSVVCLSNLASFDANGMAHRIADLFLEAEGIVLEPLAELTSG